MSWRRMLSDDFKLSQVIPIPKTVASKELGDFRPYISFKNILKNSWTNTKR